MVALSKLINIYIFAATYLDRLLSQSLTRVVVIRKSRLAHFAILSYFCDVGLGRQVDKYIFIAPLAKINASHVYRRLLLYRSAIKYIPPRGPTNSTV